MKRPLGKSLHAIVLFAIAAPAFAQVCVQPPPSLTGWWPGDGDAKDIAAGNDGTLSGAATYASGKVLQAFSFPSAGSVDIPYSAVATPQAVTIDAWVNPTTFVAGASIFDWRPATNTTGIQLNIDGNGTGLVEWNFYTSAGLNTLVSAHKLATGQWTHVAATFDGYQATLYFNGNLELTLNLPRPLTTIAADAKIGRNIVSGNAFNGLIDEVEVYDRALSQSEIATLVAAGPAGICKDVLFRNGYGDYATLTASVSGSVPGTVTSNPAGINCGATCSADLPLDSVVQLTATPGANSAFVAWTSSACSGPGPCTVVMRAATSVTANFDTVHTNCIGAACSGWTLGQTFEDYIAPGTISLTQAEAAAAAWPGGSFPANSYEAVCGSGTTNNVYVNPARTGTACAVWRFGGAAAGHVNYSTVGCGCPTTTDPTWN